MPLYEHRKGGRAVERVRTVRGSFEDTRLGLMHHEREKAKNRDGWHVVDETTAAKAPAPEDTTSGG